MRKLTEDIPADGPVEEEAGHQGANGAEEKRNQAGSQHGPGGADGVIEKLAHLLEDRLRVERLEGVQGAGDVARQSRLELADYGVF